MSNKKFKEMDEANDTNLTSGILLNRRKVIGTMGVLACSLLPNTVKSAPLLPNGDNLKVLSFSSLKEAKESSEISIGILVKTAGYYTFGDGGAATYYITNNAN